MIYRQEVSLDRPALNNRNQGQRAPVNEYLADKTTWFIDFPAWAEAAYKTPIVHVSPVSYVFVIIQFFISVYLYGQVLGMAVWRIRTRGIV